jgi:hypothetical protein
MPAVLEPLYADFSENRADELPAGNHAKGTQAEYQTTLNKWQEWGNGDRSAVDRKIPLHFLRRQIAPDFFAENPQSHRFFGFLDVWPPAVTLLEG